MTAVTAAAAIIRRAFTTDPMKGTDTTATTTDAIGVIAAAHAVTTATAHRFMAALKNTAL